MAADTQERPAERGGWPQRTGLGRTQGLLLPGQDVREYSFSPETWSVGAEEVAARALGPRLPKRPEPEPGPQPGGAPRPAQRWAARLLLTRPDRRGRLALSTECP